MAAPVIAFDLDGTLVETAPDLIGTLNWVLTQNGFSAMDHATARPTIGHGARAMIEQSLDLQKVSADKSDVDRMHASFLTYYGEHIADESYPFPGLDDALDHLTERGCTLAVCTNKGEQLSRMLLDHLDLSKRFAAICGADTFPRRKPDPLHLFGTIEQASGIPTRAVMVGDSITDIKTAKNADIPVVAVDFGYTNVPVSELNPDVVISHYDELVPAIEKIAPHIFA